MASHQITIAKAAFTAACLRPDVTPLTRDDVANFHDILETVVSRCSPFNVQNSNKWITEHIVLSLPRTTALAKYLVAFSKNVKPDTAQATTTAKVASAERKRLHVLYVLNDVFHHTKYHNSVPTSRAHLEEGFAPHLPQLWDTEGLANTTAVRRRLEQLLGIWEIEQYFHKEIIAQLRQVKSSGGQAETAIRSTVGPLKELPYTMPATHGDSTTPYYDLPAANLMPHIVPNKPVPMRADQIRALQLSAGPAEETLVNAVKDFLKDVDHIDHLYQTLENEGIVADMDELGQLSYRNQADKIIGDTYYGWSRDFCVRMKKRSRGESDVGGRRRSQSYSSSRSSSRSRGRSESPTKRRRYDTSGSRSPSAVRPRHRSRSASRSRERYSSVFQQDKARSTPLQHSTTLTPPFAMTNMPYPTIPLGPAGLPLPPPPPPPDYTGPWPPPPPLPTPSSYNNRSFPQIPQYFHGSNGSFSANQQSQKP